jgi:8-oxo-dGTP pyrophosphatase MutT (NUDIX family)
MKLEEILDLPASLVEHDVPYLPTPNTVEVVITGIEPPDELSPTAFMMAVDGDGRVAYAMNARRGIEVAGGHVDPGETPREAAEREAVEEVGARVEDVRPLGFLRCISHGEPSPEYRAKYPWPISFQRFYVGRLTELGAHTMPDECNEPVMLDAEGVASAAFRYRNVAVLHAAAVHAVLDAQPSAPGAVLGRGACP